jgi:hypothetical protein
MSKSLDLRRFTPGRLENGIHSRHHPNGLIVRSRRHLPRVEPLPVKEGSVSEGPSNVNA